MNKKLILFITCLFYLTGSSVFSQKKSEVIVTGTVYISSSISNGAIGYPSSSEGPYPFRKQTIYFKNDSTNISARTDSAGVFSIKLKAGQYIVYQEGGLNNEMKGLNHFGTDVIEVKKDGGPYKISFHNSSNRRVAMSSGKSNGGPPSSKPTKTTQIKPENK